MNKSGPPRLTDWVGFTVRWIYLIAVSIFFSYNHKMDWLGLVVLMMAVAGNVTLLVLFITERMSNIVRLISTTVDFIFGMLFTSLALLADKPFFWTGLLPVVTGGLYYRWIGLIITATTAFLAQFGVYYLFFLHASILPPAILAFLLYLVFGIGAVYSGNMLRSLSSDTEETPKQKELAEQKDILRRRTIYDLISRLSATLNYEKVLETALDLANSALSELGAPIELLKSAVLLYAEKGAMAPQLDMITSRGMLPSDKAIILPGVDGVLAAVIEKGEAAFAENPLKDPELNRFASLWDSRSAFILPLRSGLDAYGVLLFAHSDRGFFSPERQEILEIIRNQATIAMQNARLYQALDEEKNRMMEIQEESRKKLARDLHDGPTQSVSTIAMRVNFARRLMDRDVKAASEEMFKIEDLARRTTKEIRHMLFTLRPLVLESHGLVAALQSMADKVKETYGQQVTIQVDPRLAEKLEPSKQGVVFFIVEEAVNNARKHASAELIQVRFRLIRDEISLLEIEDNGDGFDLKAVDTSYENRGSLGMVNLRERAELVNGVLHINSVKGKGTNVQVVIPLSEEAAELLRRGG